MQDRYRYLERVVARMIVFVHSKTIHHRCAPWLVAVLAIAAHVLCRATQCAQQPVDQSRCFCRVG